MKAFLASLAGLLAGAASASTLARRGHPPPATGPFLTVLSNDSWVIGNELWNMTQGQTYGVELYYKNHDCVGDAVGHYVSYSKSAVTQARRCI